MVSAALQIANSLQLAFSEQLATTAAHDPDSITNAADAAISSIGSAFFAAASAYGADAAIANSIDGAASASSSADADAETASPNTSYAANSVAPAAAPVPRSRARRQRSSTDEIICEQCKRGNHPETLLLCDGCVRHASQCLPHRALALLNWSMFFLTSTSHSVLRLPDATTHTTRTAYSRLWPRSPRARGTAPRASARLRGSS
jgi:hypothetical protein